MRVAAIQHDIAWEDGAATRERLTPLISQAAAGGARLITVTEMYATGFSMKPEAIAEAPGGPNETFLAEHAVAHQVWLIGSVAQWADSASPDEPVTESQTRRATNTAIVAGPNGERFRYDKIHPFSYADEHLHYQGGQDRLSVTIDDLRVSVFICYDLRFADEFWPMAPTTDLYVVPANWPEPRRDHWQTLLRARAIENQAYVIGCNRVGRVDRVNYVGDSAIIDPLGRVLSQASVAETVLFADVEAEQVQRVRARFPFLADRR